VFPYVKKDMYDKSPAKRSVGGIPVMTIVGLLSMLFLIFMTYYYITVPGLAGLSLITIETVVGLFIASTVIYFASRMYHKSKGIDLDMVFKEIPPE
ncbi:MAG: APC family permease, partial [Nitrososphaerales archaeon]